MYITIMKLVSYLPLISVAIAAPVTQPQASDLSNLVAREIYDTNPKYYRACPPNDPINFATDTNWQEASIKIVNTWTDDNNKKFVPPVGTQTGSLDVQMLDGSLRKLTLSVYRKNPNYPPFPFSRDDLVNMFSGAYQGPDEYAPCSRTDSSGKKFVVFKSFQTEWRRDGFATLEFHGDLGPTIV